MMWPAQGYRGIKASADVRWSYHAGQKITRMTAKDVKRGGPALVGTFRRFTARQFGCM